MTREEMIEIAKVGFPLRVQNQCVFDKCKIHHTGGVYRLYDDDFLVFIPRHSYLEIFVGEDNFIQITCGNKAFNHYAAIKKMESLNLIV